MQVILDTVPVSYEPGHENTIYTDKKNIDYNNIIEYGNYHHAMISLLENPGHDFLPLKPKMIELFTNNFPKIYNKMLRFKDKYNCKTIHFDGAGAVKRATYEKINVSDLIKKTLQLYEKFNGSPFDTKLYL